MKKIKLKNIIYIDKSLKSLIENKDLNIDVVSKFTILGILKKLEPHIANFEYVNNEKVKQYGKTLEDGTVLIDPKTDSEAFELYTKEMNALIETDIEIEPINAEDIFSKNIPAEYLVILYDLISEF